jgi:hypothetical protein
MWLMPPARVYEFSDGRLIRYDAFSSLARWPMFCEARSVSFRHSCLYLRRTRSARSAPVQYSRGCRDALCSSTTRGRTQRKR